jgi:hypothetical protein
MTAVQNHRVTQRRVLRSEWSKLGSLRSSWITVVLACVVLLAFGLSAGAAMAQSVAKPGNAAPAPAAMAPAAAAQAIARTG